MRSEESYRLEITKAIEQVTNVAEAVQVLKKIIKRKRKKNLDELIEENHGSTNSK